MEIAAFDSEGDFRCTLQGFSGVNTKGDFKGFTLAALSLEYRERNFCDDSKLRLNTREESKDSNLQGRKAVIYGSL